MSCDSQVHVELQIGDEVVIEKYAAPLAVVVSTWPQFLSVLSQ